MVEQATRTGQIALASWFWMMFTLTSMEGEAEMVGVNTCLHVHTFP